MEFKTVNLVKLLNTTKQTAIDKNQFIQSVDNLRVRLCEPNEIDAHYSK